MKKGQKVVNKINHTNQRVPIWDTLLHMNNKYCIRTKGPEI